MVVVIVVVIVLLVLYVYLFPLIERKRLELEAWIQDGIQTQLSDSLWPSVERWKEWMYDVSPCVYPYHLSIHHITLHWPSLTCKRCLTANRYRVLVVLGEFHHCYIQLRSLLWTFSGILISLPLFPYSLFNSSSLLLFLSSSLFPL